MAATTSSYPPIISHPPRPISPSEALAQIQAYLALSLTNPSLHPAAQLTERGPTADLSSSSAGGLMLHNLRRVEAGLRGERWGDADGEGNGNGGEGAQEMAEAGWEDMGQYQREQGVIEDVGDVQIEVPIEVQESGKPVDKVERKRLKKQREKAMRREKQQMRAREAAAEKG
ncbi:MAG: hypothetical protein M1839_002479 [Geoglossum umbratile]|nr:MAG: hypothetical protein M1839_002479 [Geoglossum umbratile]